MANIIERGVVEERPIIVPGSFEDCLNQFKKVAEGFTPRNQTLGWELSVTCTTMCLKYIDAPETQEFIKQYLFKMIHLLLTQR